MNQSLRTIRHAPIWVLLAILIMAVFAATQVAQPLPAPTGLVAAFQDTNGNGIDDDCEENVVADPDAETAAEAAVDLDGDGTISVSEAAQSDRVGGTNCNHGGYVSWVAHGSCPDPAPEPAPALVTGPALEAAVATCDEPTTLSDGAATQARAAAKAAKDAAKAEKKAARDAAKAARNAAHEAAKAEREAAKAAKTAARDAAKAVRDAAKAEKKAARDAAKLAKQTGKGKSRNH